MSDGPVPPLLCVTAWPGSLLQLQGGTLLQQEKRKKRLDILIAMEKQVVTFLKLGNQYLMEDLKDAAELKMIELLNKENMASYFLAGVKEVAEAAIPICHV